MVPNALASSAHLGKQFSPRVQDFFKYLDLLIFVEATIYQADETNELYAKQGLLLSQAHSESMPCHALTCLNP